MCTVVLLRRPGHAWPLILGANRDERRDRPWKPPARHWPDRDSVVAGLDALAGGTWLGVNDHGLVAAVMNREGSLGPIGGKRSRGELPLEALDHAEAEEAARALADLDGRAWRPFNLILADSRQAFWIRSTGEARVTCTPIAEGLSMITAGDLNAPDVPRIRTWLPRFREAPVPDPGAGDWASWMALMASGPAAKDPDHAAMMIGEDQAYGTVSSSLIACRAHGSGEGPETGPSATPEGGRPALHPAIWLFAPGMPARTGWHPLTLARNIGAGA